MRIAVNTRLLIKNKLDGIGWFSYETLKRITQQHPEHEFYFIFDRQYSSEFIFSENIKPVIIGPPARHPFLYLIWFEYSINRVLKKIKPDIFLSPDGFVSLSSMVKTVSVIHDINFEHLPEHLPFYTRTYYRFFFRRFARKSKRIATVSEFSKKDIADCYKINPDKIDVVYNGSNEIYIPLFEVEKKAVREKYTDNSPYFIFISSIQPRKNLINLFRAFEIFKEEYSSDIKLLIIGEKRWWTKEMNSVFDEMKHKNDVIFCGWLLPNELKNVLGAALALTYVSYFEGFGIPIVEAMYCDTPVITSNCTSMPEIAGDAALIVDPFSPESICSAMLKIAKDKNVSADLIKKGQIRRQEFSWQKSADLLWNCVMKAASSR
ncbi:MAG: glycosyltransferase family 1 protein [Bacteroidales bacterium]|nr:glycosyltransferase family 1 protein [Bacteroidales bacterium]